MAKSNNQEATLGNNKSSKAPGTEGPRSSGKANDPKVSVKQTGSAYAGANEGLKSEGKSNHETATLRAGNLPKPEVVKDAKPTPGVAVKCAQKQNTSDGKDWPKGRNVLVNKADESLVVTAVAKVKE